MTVTPDTAGHGGSDSGAALRTPNEVRALAVLAFDELAGFPGAIRDMHLGIAARAFRAVGPAGRPVQLIHDALSRRAYGAVGRGRGRDRAARPTSRSGQAGIGEEVRLSRSRHGSAAIAALNGLIGDRIERTGSDLHRPASVRVGGEAVALDADSLARRRLPGRQPAAGRVPARADGRPSSTGTGAVPDGRDLRRAPGRGPRLHAGVPALQHRPAHLRERALAWRRCSRQLVAGVAGAGRGDRPDRAFDGRAGRPQRRHHARSARPGVDRTRRPRGLARNTRTSAPRWSRAAHVSPAALYALPETRMLGAFLRRRSAGIRDLRHGSLVDEDWHGRDPNSLRAAACSEVPLLEGADALLRLGDRHARPAPPARPAARRHPRARCRAPPGAGARAGFRSAPSTAITSDPRHHLALLNHPEVYERLREWLAGAVAGQNS